MSAAVNLSLRDVAMKLARGHFTEGSSLRRVYVFPSDHEIRLIDVDAESPESGTDRVVPFRFRPDPLRGVPFPSCIALIPPDEEKRIALPEGWGAWEDAEVVGPH